MARVLQYICGGLVIGILSVLVNIHPAAATCTVGGCNGGKCPDTTGDCECVNGYTGATCDTPPCTPNGNECTDNGDCTGTAPNIKCTCKNGWSGNLCATAPCTANGKECGDNGDCTGADATSKCTCKNGWSGDLCTTGPICKAGGTECGDHGSCDTSATTYKCKCKDSYTGTKCTTAPESSSPAVRLSLMSLVVSSIVCFIVL